MTGDELRRTFLRFFEDRGHKVIPSSSLVPHDDPSLLLTSAGMVQIKPYFLGLASPPNRRLTSCQKCFRTTDIESVGDSKHLTFFEMLGNFSVGDYFKKETIAWAWEFVTKHLKLPEERLWITIYYDDEESFAYWRQLGIPADKILRFGEENNFWGPVGDSGPCGPCSEIHYDLGKEFGCGKADCKPNCECGRFSEIWNLVFTQYNQDLSGQRTPLSKPNIDTGMGLERTLAALQRKPSPYETELFLPLVNRVCQLCQRQYGKDEGVDRAIRIVAEHSRGIAFLIADGVMPSNEGRGYILRRILRRASLFGRKVGITEPFLNEMTKVVIDSMSHIYPELVANRSLIAEIVRVEEEKFNATLDAGIDLVDKFIGEVSVRGEKELAGGDVFKLYDTYGFPPELTAEIARDEGLSIDWQGFHREMERQREMARAATRTISMSVDVVLTSSAAPATEFVGYETTETRSKVLQLVVKGEARQIAFQGDEADIVLDKSPFYGEMGGQVGDTGVIIGTNGEAAIANTVRTASNVIVHRGKITEGSISVGSEVQARVDVGRREDIARNHTATHLLQAALREILGKSVYQKGTLVEADRLRFDFSQLTPISEQQLKDIQRQVNEWIRANLRVEAKVLPYKEAIAEGAIALFEEKYGETVRMLKIGEPAISKELCGGTHVRSTGEVGTFLIISESSIGTGLRRIEAVTGRKAESLIESRLAALQSIAKSVQSSPEEAPAKVKALVSELEAERKRVTWLERELSRNLAEGLSRQVEEVSGVRLLAARVPPLSMPVLREMGDILRDKLRSGIVVLATVHNGKPSFLAMVTSDLVARGFHAGDIVNQVAKVAGGGGGGKAGMAQAGGKDAAKIDEALGLVRSVIASKST